MWDCWCAPRDRCIYICTNRFDTDHIMQASAWMKMNKRVNVYSTCAGADDLSTDASFGNFKLRWTLTTFHTQSNSIFWHFNVWNTQQQSICIYVFLKIQSMTYFSSATAKHSSRTRISSSCFQSCKLPPLHECRDLGVRSRLSTMCPNETTICLSSRIHTWRFLHHPFLHIPISLPPPFRWFDFSFSVQNNKMKWRELSLREKINKWPNTKWLQLARIFADFKRFTHNSLAAIFSMVKSNLNLRFRTNKNVTRKKKIEVYVRVAHINESQPAIERAREKKSLKFFFLFLFQPTLTMYLSVIHSVYLS